MSPTSGSRCAWDGCTNDGAFDVDTVIGSVYVCEDHFEAALDELLFWYLGYETQVRAVFRLEDQ